MSKVLQLRGVLLDIPIFGNIWSSVAKKGTDIENGDILLKETTTNITSQEGGFLNFLWPLTMADLPLMKSLLAPFAKSVLIPIGLSAGMSAVDAAIQKKIYGSETTALII